MSEKIAERRELSQKWRGVKEEGELNVWDGGRLSSWSVVACLAVMDGGGWSLEVDEVRS